MKSADAQPPIISEHNKSKSHLWLWMVSSVVIILAAIVFAFDPQRSGFYPICVFKKTTGWSCPACGCLRASHQLLHGHVVKAFYLNALFVIALPIAALLAVQAVLRKRIINPSYVGWSLLVAFVLFGIARNLPPFVAWSGQ
jgi:hypothetical protein